MRLESSLVLQYIKFEFPSIVDFNIFYVLLRRKYLLLAEELRIWEKCNIFCIDTFILFKHSPLHSLLDAYHFHASQPTN